MKGGVPGILSYGSVIKDLVEFHRFKRFGKRDPMRETDIRHSDSRCNINYIIKNWLLAH